MNPASTPRTARAAALVALFASGGVAAPVLAQEARPGANLGFDPSYFTDSNIEYSGRFTFVRLMGKSPKRRARLMKWEGASKTARLAYLFSHDR